MALRLISAMLRAADLFAEHTWISLASLGSWAQGFHLFRFGEEVAGASCISWSWRTAASWRACSCGGEAAARGAETAPRAGESAASYATTEAGGGGLARLLAPAPMPIQSEEFTLYYR